MLIRQLFQYNGFVSFLRLQSLKTNPFFQDFKSQNPHYLVKYEVIHSAYYFGIPLHPGDQFATKLNPTRRKQERVDG